MRQPRQYLGRERAVQVPSRAVGVDGEEVYQQRTRQLGAVPPGLGVSSPAERIAPTNKRTALRLPATTIARRTHFTGWYSSGGTRRRRRARDVHRAARRRSCARVRLHRVETATDGTESRVSGGIGQSWTGRRPLPCAERTVDWNEPVGGRGRITPRASGPVPTERASVTSARGRGGHHSSARASPPFPRSRTRGGAGADALTGGV